jgi:hypothetical protein
MTARPIILSSLALTLAACSGEAPEGRNMSVNEVAAELASIRIDPGLWESRSEVLDVTAPNLPREVQNRMKGPPQVTRHCISEEQAARPDANFLATQRDNCTYRDFAMREGRIEGSMICQGGDITGEARATMNGRYGPDRYEMRMRMEMDGPADATMVIETRASGRRIGECPAEGESKQ